MERGGRGGGERGGAAAEEEEEEEDGRVARATGVQEKERAWLRSGGAKRIGRELEREEEEEPREVRVPRGGRGGREGAGRRVLLLARVTCHTQNVREAPPPSAGLELVPGVQPRSPQAATPTSPAVEIAPPRARALPERGGGEARRAGAEAGARSVADAGAAERAAQAAAGAGGGGAQAQAAARVRVRGGDAARGAAAAAARGRRRRDGGGGAAPAAALRGPERGRVARRQEEEEEEEQLGERALSGGELPKEPDRGRGRWAAALKTRDFWNYGLSTRLCSALHTSSHTVTSYNSLIYAPVYVQKWYRTCKRTVN